MLMPIHRWPGLPWLAVMATTVAVTAIGCSSNLPPSESPTDTFAALDADGGQVDASGCSATSCLDLGVHTVAGFSNEGGACVLYSMQRIQGYQLQHIGCHQQGGPEKDYMQWELVRWRAPDKSEITTGPLGSALDIRQAGIIPVIGTDTIWCDWPSCKRIDKMGNILWTSATGKHRGARIDGALVRGDSVFVPTFVPFATSPIAEQLAVARLDLATGVTETVWPNYIPEMDLHSILLRSIRNGLQDSLLAAGTVYYAEAEVDKVGDPSWPFVAKLDSDGTYAWATRLPSIERRSTRAEVAVVAGTKSVLALIGQRPKDDSFTRQMLVVKLSEVNGSLETTTLLPGTYPNVGDGIFDASQPYITMAAVHGGRFLILGLTFQEVTPVLKFDFNYGYPYAGIAHVLDVHGNLLQTFFMPGVVVEVEKSPAIGWPASTQSPQLAASDKNGYTIVFGNKEVRLDSWGHSSVASAGACATLSWDDCQDNDPCTNDGCDPKLGCIHPTFADGAACSAKGTCKAGVCVEP